MLSAGTYTLTQPANGDGGGNGLPVITSAMTIYGHGATITRSTEPATPLFRIASVAAGGSLTLDDLTISHGAVGAYPAGGLRNWGALTLDNCVVENNTAGGSGGGISQEYGATLTISGSTLRRNHAGNTGGGLRSLDSHAVLENSVVQENTVAGAGDGGGIMSSTTSAAVATATLTLNHTVVTGNTAEGAGPSGGGVAVASNSATPLVLTINDSTIADNRAQYGGGVVVAGNVQDADVRATINRSTISNNLAADPAGGDADGGGIEAYNSTVMVVNSTVSGNRVAAAGYSSGGAIWIGGYAGRLPSRVTLINSTLNGNSAAGAGGGIVSYQDSANASAMVTSVNTIVSGNYAPAGGNCRAEGGAFTSLGHNVENADSCGFHQPTDHPNTDPPLGPLADNGGSTLTHALLPGSPAIGAADSAVCAATPVNNADQRGVSRPQAFLCDAGAYEAQEVPTAVTLGGLYADSGATAPAWRWLTLLGACWGLVAGTRILAARLSSIWQ
jgi:predicted outer membrane repeat protein